MSKIKHWLDSLNSTIEITEVERDQYYQIWRQERKEMIGRKQNRKNSVRDPWEDGQDRTEKNSWTNILGLVKSLEYTIAYICQYSISTFLKFNKYTQNSANIHLGSSLCTRFMSIKENFEQITERHKCFIRFHNTIH